MNELKTKGIVIGSADYKEKDKLVDIFTLENGVITAKLVGCKAINAKLKFAGQPFCFADFIIAQKNGYNSIISANIIDSFFDLTKNYENYQNAFKMLEIVKGVVKKGEINQPLFVVLLKCLNAICNNNTNSKIILLKFLLQTYSLSGYEINFDYCSECANKFDTKKYLKNYSSEFVCSVCRDEQCSFVDNAIFNALKILNNCDLEKLNSIKLKQELLEKCGEILLLNFKNVFNLNIL